MKIKTEGNIINIYGNIKSIEDYERIKTELDKVKKVYDRIIINIIDSISLTSSVIGYLTKLVDEGIKITIKVKKELFDLLVDLNLIDKFNVRIFE